MRGELQEGEAGGDPGTQAAAAPTATRHLILIRHGQYHMDAPEEEKVLTEVGRKQASATGKRLKELELPFAKMCVSTVVRARETADLGRTRKMTLRSTSIQYLGKKHMRNLPDF